MPLDLDLARTAEDLRHVWMLPGIAPRAGHDKLPYRTMRDWWRSYPEGLTLLRAGAELIGALALWPLQAAPWERFASGQTSAAQLTDGDRHPAPAACATWFLAGVSLRAYRQTHALPLLLGGAIERWCAWRDQAQPQRVVCLPGGRADRQLLRRFGGRLRPLEPQAPPGMAARWVLPATAAELYEQLRSTLLPIGG